MTHITIAGEFQCDEIAETNCFSKADLSKGGASAKYELPDGISCHTSKPSLSA